MKKTGEKKGKKFKGSCSTLVSLRNERSGPPGAGSDSVSWGKANLCRRNRLWLKPITAGETRCSDSEAENLSDVAVIRFLNKVCLVWLEYQPLIPSLLMELGDQDISSSLYVKLASFIAMLPSEQKKTLSFCGCSVISRSSLNCGS